MNLETLLIKEHWNSIRRSYEASQWTNAVLDSMHYLSDVIRDKSGLQGDGASLVGQAFGGKAPKIRLNRLETESEKNIQLGMEQIIRGLYQGIRNPRSHERVEDDQGDCVAIIIFIDYLLKVICAAKSAFSIDQCVGQILDPGFCTTEKYSELLVSEIPQRHYLSVAIEAFKKCHSTAPGALKPFFKVLLSRMNGEDQREFFSFLSEELRGSLDHNVIRSAFQILNEDDWLNISEIARLRTENFLLIELRKGKYNRHNNQIVRGNLPTWSRTFWPHFSMKNEYVDAITELLLSSDNLQVDYALEYIFPFLDYLVDSPPTKIESAMIFMLKKGDVRFLKALDEPWYWNGSSWSAAVIEAKDKFKPSQNLANLSEDELPF